jgi:hypothetical protein
MTKRNVCYLLHNRTVYWQSQKPLIARAVVAVVAVECCRGGDWVVTGKWRGKP